VIKSLIWVFLPLIAVAALNPDVVLQAKAPDYGVFFDASFEHAFLKQGSVQ
jgi:hypothetical protein